MLKNVKNYNAEPLRGSAPAPSIECKIFHSNVSEYLEEMIKNDI